MNAPQGGITVGRGCRTHGAALPCMWCAEDRAREREREQRTRLANRRTCSHLPTSRTAPSSLEFRVCNKPECLNELILVLRAKRDELRDAEREIRIAEREREWAERKAARKARVPTPEELEAKREKKREASRRNWKRKQAEKAAVLAKIQHFIDEGAASPVAFRLLHGMHDGAIHVGAVEVLEPHRHYMRHLSPSFYYKPTHDHKLCTNCGATPCLNSCAFRHQLEDRDTRTVLSADDRWYL